VANRRLTSFKRVLQAITIALASLFTTIVIVATLYSGNGYLELLQLFTAPFEALLLVILWTLYIVMKSKHKKQSF
jgi:hypothetical protein